MVKCVVKALADWSGKITVSAGEHVLNPVDSVRFELARSDVQFINYSHGQYLEELDRSRVLVSSPGLHGIQEALARHIPCLLLPSQNLSQVLTLRRLRKAGATFALDWDVIYDLADLSATDEHRSCQLIANCIREFAHDVLAQARLVGHLVVQLRRDSLERIASAQAAFFDRHRTEDGPKQVAAYIQHLVRPRLV
jgi:hypothetical protein